MVLAGEAVIAVTGSLIGVERVKWLGVRDDFRNWLALGLQAAKAHENRPRVRMAPAGAARSNRASGAVEAEQLFDPERA